MGTDQVDPEGTDPATTIAQQQAEIERLNQRIQDDRFAADLRDTLTRASATATIAAPVGYRPLVDMIVAMAADMVDADAAALFLFDIHGRELLLEGVFGANAKPATDVRIAPGQGMIGLVATTGQPMAVSGADEDVRVHALITQALGYAPQNLMCVPLSFHDRVIGVLAIIDKKGDATFGADEMESSGIFAHLAAVAVEQNRSETRLAALLVNLIKAVDGLPDIDSRGMTDRARAFASQLGRQTGYLRALELAELVQEVVQRGEAATKACSGVLASFVEFLRAQPAPGSELATW